MHSFKSLLSEYPFDKNCWKFIQEEKTRGGRGAAYNTHTVEKVFRDFIVKHIECGGRGAVYMNIH